MSLFIFLSICVRRSDYFFFFFYYSGPTEIFTYCPTPSLPDPLPILHRVVCTLFLALCLKRLYNGDFTPKQHFGFEAAAWYWHFVDVVWLFLFISIYVWGSDFGAAPLAAH